MIDDKGIDDDSFLIILNELMTRNSNLRILSLNNNLIGDKGCEYLNDYFLKFSSLEILYLSKINSLLNIMR